MKTKSNIFPFEATHPGSLLKDELEAIEMSQNDLAIETGLGKTIINEIIKGKRSITAEIAILLEKALGISADYWMRFQSQYEIDLVRIKEKNIIRLANMEYWKIIKNYIPVTYFRRIKYFVDDLSKDIQKVKDVYDIKDIDQLVNLTARQKFALYRKSDKLQIDENNMLAWSSVAKYEAKQQQVNTYHPENIPTLIGELNRIFYSNKNTIDSVQRKLNQYGIKFVIVQKIEKAPIDGFTFWSGNNPAIALTLRHNRIDNLAFTILHEIGHILLHLKSNKDEHFYDLNGYDSIMQEKEKEADTYAQVSLIPEDIWVEFKKLTLVEDYSIKKLAKTYKIHPAIIHGRICHENQNFSVRTSIDKTLK